MFDTKHLPDGAVIVTDSDTLNTRYVVYQDDRAESPTEWDYDSEVMVYRTAYNGRVDTPADELATVFQRVLDQHNDDTLALLVTQRYARIILGWSPARANESIVTYSARGYSQGNWWDILAITHEDEYAESLAKEWEQWARGDVWCVMLETSTVCDKGDTHWDAATDQGIDSIVLSGIYADDAESAVAEYLGMI